MKLALKLESRSLNEPVFHDSWEMLCFSFVAQLWDLDDRVSSTFLCVAQLFSHRLG